jgi:hypothetical protein
VRHGARVAAARPAGVTRTALVPGGPVATCACVLSRCCAEFIVDGDAWTRTLPDTIDAFFQTIDGAAEREHRAFLESFGLTAAQVPLLNMNLEDWAEPFRAVR